MSRRYWTYRDARCDIDGRDVTIAIEHVELQGADGFAEALQDWRSYCTDTQTRSRRPCKCASAGDLP
jgi:hypothetical protein